jgi:tRNA dimethylallyltransferase
MSADDTPVLILTGTTASGKNRMGASLARRLDGEVLSLDSMKVYRGMDIGTAKPTAAEQAQAPHRLIDLLSPREAMHLRRFVDLAHEARRDAARRKKTPVVVGGTQLYLHGFLHGVFEGPPQDQIFRERLRAEAAALGVPALHARLRACDPTAAGRIHENDYKRIERALEVHHATGRPISALQAEGTVPSTFPRRVAVLTWDRAVLAARIEARVVEMFREGFVDEVRRILAEGGFGREAGDALGYPETIALLAGKISEDEAIRLIQNGTRQFARKQLTWLRKLPADLRFECRTPEEFAAAEEAIYADFTAFRRRAVGRD